MTMTMITMTMIMMTAMMLMLRQLQSMTTTMTTMAKFEIVALLPVLVLDHARRIQGGVNIINIINITVIIIVTAAATAAAISTFPVTPYRYYNGEIQRIPTTMALPLTDHPPPPPPIGSCYGPPVTMDGIITAATAAKWVTIIGIIEMLTNSLTD